MLIMTFMNNNYLNIFGIDTKITHVKILYTKAICVHLFTENCEIAQHTSTFLRTRLTWPDLIIENIEECTDQRLVTFNRFL